MPNQTESLFLIKNIWVVRSTSNYYFFSLALFSCMKKLVINTNQLIAYWREGWQPRQFVIPISARQGNAGYNSWHFGVLWGDCRVLHGTAGYYWVLLATAGYYWVTTGYWMVLGGTGMHWSAFLPLSYRNFLLLLTSQGKFLQVLWKWIFSPRGQILRI